MDYSFLESETYFGNKDLCYFCNKDCSKYMVVYAQENFCSTECVSSYSTFNEMVDYFDERNRN